MKFLLSIVMLLMISSAVAFAADASVAGTWKVEGDVQGTPVNQDCTIKQDGKKITGTCKSADLATTEIAGDVNDHTVTWKFNIDYNGQALAVTFTGTLNATSDGIKGTINVQPLGADGDFTAKREEEKK